MKKTPKTEHDLLRERHAVAEVKAREARMALDRYEQGAKDREHAENEKRDAYLYNRRVWDMVEDHDCIRVYEKWYSNVQEYNKCVAVCYGHDRKANAQIIMDAMRKAKGVRIHDK